jgi:hypothetical protein
MSTPAAWRRSRDVLTDLTFWPIAFGSISDRGGHRKNLAGHSLIWPCQAPAIFASQLARLPRVEAARSSHRSSSVGACRSSPSIPRRPRSAARASRMPLVRPPPPTRRSGSVARRRPPDRARPRPRHGHTQYGQPSLERRHQGDAGAVERDAELSGHQETGYWVDNYYYIGVFP